MPVQIPINELVVDKRYVGRGRNANVGMWDGHHFLVISEKFEDHVIKREPYYTAETGCFQPFAVVDEGVVVEPFGTDIWDKHYGRRLEFGMNQEDPGNIRAKSVATRESESDTADLISQWKASIYLPDGVRSNVTLVLNADKTFLYEVTADHSQPDAPSGPKPVFGCMLHPKIC